jgi:tRNA(Ile)-lysidine synthase
MLNEFEKKVVDYCKRQKMFPDKHGGTVLVALSGGGDSVALLDVMLKAREVFGISVEAAHLNHSLRGKESDDDENFTRELCAKLGIFLTVKRLPEGVLAGNEGSLETAAREARMEFLSHSAAERNAERIATGHTLNDQVETVLQRLIRGTGPSGLAGILPVRDNLWVRPFLGVTRKEIREYLEKEGLFFREDSTNQETVFIRNRIRHELIPFLKGSFSPGVTGSIARLAELSRVQEDYLEEKALDAFKSCCVLENSCKILLDKLKLMDYHKVLKQRVIRRCLELLEGEGRDADMEEVENVLSVFDSKRGTINITSSLQCGVGGRLVGGRLAAFILYIGPYEPVPLELPGETAIPAGGGCIIAEKTGRNVKVDGRLTVLVSPVAIEKYGALSVGSVRSGEFMTPFGMSGAVKISELIAASPLPKILRNTLPVVRAGAVPVWIPGLRSSECLRIPESGTGQPDTKDIILLTLKDGVCVET